jgi:glutathione S-transferase
LDCSIGSSRKGRGVQLGKIDPFTENNPASYLAIHPFKRVPALVHGAFAVYETGAITRYVDVGNGLAQFA